MAVRVPQVTTETALLGGSNVRVPQVTTEIANAPTNQQIRVAQVTVEMAVLPGTFSGNCGNPPQMLGGQAYTTTLVTGGGWSPFTFVVTSGVLPPGISLNATTGVISGIPVPQARCYSIVHFDPSTKNDRGSAINSYWQSGLMRGNEIKSSMIRVGACDVWARGMGTALVQVASMDGSIVLNPPLMILAGYPADLTPSPGVYYQTRFDLAQIENWTFQIGANAVDAWWELSAIGAYQMSDLSNR